MSGLDEKTTSELNALKSAHDYYVTAIELITQRIRYLPEEFQGVMNTVAFLKHLHQETLSAIHKIEPPKETEKKNYDMDLTHVGPKEAPQVELN